MINRRTLDIKIIDFGLSQEVNQRNGGMSKQIIGSFFYLSPEIIEQRKYSIEKAEVWQLGVVLYALFFSDFPFLDRDDILFKDEKRLITRNSAKYFRFDSADLLASMLSKNPSDRPTFDDVINRINNIPS